MEKQFEVTDDLFASHGQRILHYIIDIIFIYVIIFVLAMIVGFVSSLMGSTAVLGWMQTMSDNEGTLIFIVMAILYYATFEILLSRTLAKFITKTILVTEDGQKPDWQTILKRTLCRIIPFDALSYLGGSARGWHDTIPNLYVVKKDLFEEKKSLFYSFDEIGKTEESN